MESECNCIIQCHVKRRLNCFYLVEEVEPTGKIALCPWINNSAGRLSAGLGLHTGTDMGWDPSSGFSAHIDPSTLSSKALLLYA